MIRRFVRKPLAMGAFCWLAFLLVASILAPALAPYPPEAQDLAHSMEGPSWAHPLGTGRLGRDVLSRLLYGGQITFFGMFISVLTFTTVGVSLGLFAGYRSGWFDRVFLRIADVSYAVPGAIVILVVLAIRPNDETAAMITMGLLSSPSLARVVRSATLAVRNELYIKVAEMSGLSDALILWRHVLPRIMGTVIVHTALFGAAAIALETGLGFLGLGTTQVTWGSMVAEASENLGLQPWLLVPSGGLIVSVILALGLIGDGLRDAAAETTAGVALPARLRSDKRKAVAEQLAVVETPELVDSVPAATPAGTDNLMEVSDLTVTFDIDGRPVEVVSGLSFSVARGENVGIVGESGCGKSVTAAALVALLRGSGRVRSGRLVFDGLQYDLTKGEGSVLRGKAIGFIGQEPMSALDPSYTVGYQIAEVVRTHTGRSKAEAEKRALELLAEVRLPDPEAVASSYPHQLSGGMAQRVCIAAALAGDPSVVLADEPTTALDVTVQAEILDLLRDLSSHGRAVVLVTHDWGVLADLCDRAIVMYAGQIVETAPVEDLVARPQHPYTLGLLRSNPHFTERGGELPAIPGSVPPPQSWPVGCHFAERCSLVVDACRAKPVPIVHRDGPGVTRCLRPNVVAAEAPVGEAS